MFSSNYLRFIFILDISNTADKNSERNLDSDFSWQIKVQNYIYNLIFWV